MACDRCDDTGWKAVTTDGVRRVVRCDCWLQKGASQRIDRANIPKRYQHCTFENFRAYNDSLKRGLNFARRVVNEVPLDATGDKVSEATAAAGRLLGRLCEAFHGYEPVPRANAAGGN